MGAAVASVITAAFRAGARVSPNHVSLVYRLFVDSRVNPASGRAVETWHDVPVPLAKRTSVKVQEVGSAGIQVGDASFTFAEADLAGHLRYAKNKRVSTSDRVVCEGVTTRVMVFDDSGPVLRVITRV